MTNSHELVPAKLIVIRHMAYTYACRPCGGEVETAPKPGGPIAKCLAGPGLLAHVIVNKSDDHLPVYRQEEIFRRNGIDISRSTMCGWLMGCAAALEPVYRLMHRRILRSRVVQTDASSIYDIFFDETRFGTRVVEAGCWAHARRSFERAKLEHPAQAIMAMAWIRKLYAIEDEAKRMSKRRRCTRWSSRRRRAGSRIRRSGWRTSWPA